MSVTNAVAEKQLAGRSSSAAQKPSWQRTAVPVSPVSLPPRDKCACGGGWASCQKNLPIQTKLISIGEPGDLHEQEADRLADQVMSRSGPLSQRPHAADQQEPAKSEAHEKQQILRAEFGGDARRTVDESVIDNLGSGQQLDSSTRAFFEPRFGYDFGDVRIHSSEAATHSAQRVNALAYTTGTDIMFGAGQYAPSTTAGQRLLAHELVHVIQQSTTSQRMPVLQTKADPAEQPKPTFTDCSGSQRAHISKHLTVAQQWVGAAINELESLLARPANFLFESRPLRRWFSIHRGFKPDPSERVREILAAFREIHRGLSSPPIRCDHDYDPYVWGTTSATWFYRLFADIVLRPCWFDSENPNLKCYPPTSVGLDPELYQTLVLIHEVAHKYAGKRDVDVQRKDINGKTVEVPALDFFRPESEQLVSPDEAFKSADRYASFARDVQSRAPSTARSPATEVREAKP